MSGKNLEFEIYFSSKARKQLKDLDHLVQKRIKEAVKKLVVQHHFQRPEGCLIGSLPR